jgi:hypothetical protein
LFIISINNIILLLKVRRIQEYATSVIVNGRADNIDFPKGLAVVEDHIIRIVVDLSRLAVHNRAVFEDIYTSIMKGEIQSPKFLSQKENEWDPGVLKAIAMLNAEPSVKLVHKRDARNEKISDVLDDLGNLIPQREDLPYAETTPEIEKIIDNILKHTVIQDDYDEFENLTQAEAVKLLAQLRRNDSFAIVITYISHLNLFLTL